MLSIGDGDSVSLITFWWHCEYKRDKYKVNWFYVFMNVNRIEICEWKECSSSVQQKCWKNSRGFWGCTSVREAFQAGHKGRLCCQGSPSIILPSNFRLFCRSFFLLKCPEIIYLSKWSVVMAQCIPWSYYLLDSNFPRFQCKKVQTIKVKIVAVLMVMVMVVTYCTVSFYVIMDVTHCIILSKTPYCIMVMVTVKCPGISPI